MRVLLFTGKGGVGKTTASVATALHLASMGKRVIVTSADPAHSLADALGVELATEPVEVAARCWAQQMDGRERLEENWSEIRSWLMDVFDWAGVAGIAAEELAVLPGLEELFSLGEVEALCKSGDYDVVVVDCAPTAETLRLLSLPDVLNWYMERMYPASRRVNRMVAPILSRVTSLPVADDGVFEAGRRFYDRIDRVREILSDGAVTSVRLVLNPESMVIAEARRTYTYLSLFGYHVDGIVVNRVLPDIESDLRAEDDWAASWRKSQRSNLEAIANSFGGLPAVVAEHRGAEVVGAEMLTEFGAQLWGDVDASDRLRDSTTLEIFSSGDETTLAVELPFAESDEIDLTRAGGDIFVTVGPHRRCLTLPDSLRRRVVSSAKLSDGRLHIKFGAPEPARA